MSRRPIAIAFFGLAVLAGIAELAGQVGALGDPAAAAVQLGVSARAATIRAIILLALALMVALNGVIALAGALLRQALMVQFGALMAGVGLALYGAYQLASTVLQHGRLAFAAVGAVYLTLAALAFWLARAPVVAAKHT